jgi:hypothetical protein
LNLGLKKCPNESCLYYGWRDNKLFIMSTATDNLTYASSSKEYTKSIIDRLAKSFSVKQLGEASLVLGTEITQDNRATTMFQGKYIDECIEKFSDDLGNQVPSTPMDTKCDLRKRPDDQAPEVSIEKYQSLIGSILYVAICTRPDISYAISRCGRYAKNPGITHWNTVIRILAYLRGTRNYKLVYQHGQGNHHKTSPRLLYGFGDSSFNDDKEKGRSSCGFNVSVQSCTTSWKATLPQVKSMSTMEAETIIASITTREMIWYNHLFDEIWKENNTTILVLHTDNKPTEHNSTNMQVTDKSKHIRPKHFYVRDMVQSKTMSISKIPKAIQTADIFMNKFNKFGSKQLFLFQVEITEKSRAGCKVYLTNYGQMTGNRDYNTHK